MYKKRRDDRFLIFTAYRLPTAIQQCHPHSRPTPAPHQRPGLARPPGGTLHPRSGPGPAERKRTSSLLARPTRLLPEGPLA